ncbi:16S rRNA (adenine(1518)-N(6)/adenine(1519)-N(6))-dimethyltransferase RsmA [Labrys wisconsinensis]|uniref:Ribosomal RNA small subunit methyltransferase A n=1 Tax=Labrys wisconsinensis TaxID=425677 RepID=A0ABU0J220_9HYPH|nr:16S rRNA (adenine(1518)-N(6)/adenine(1519)-N(6))-dimethyltransferase RsmA [Labrys wisconsinensis]MDQ0468308.1 16S rRNA (adenine1518-N6/adenine1519-N6)-dimethyltransferase [Labrys wisconsinensis]
MAQIDDLPPLRDVIARHQLMAKKSLGQNFLLDLNLTARIARAGGDLAGVTVVEVGPGPGGLTRALLACGAERVVAVERDERCLPALAEIAARYPGRLDVHAADALTADWPALLAGVGGPVRIVANLPYNVATPLLVGWLETEPWPPWFESMTLMFQKEVAERIVAGAGDDAYGRLGVLAGWRSEAQIVFDVPPSAFVPPPKVTSSIVHLRPRPLPLACRTADLERTAQAAFGQRRKMLRQSLKGLRPDAAAWVEACGLRPEMRAEEVPVEGFVRLANSLGG